MPLARIATRIATSRRSFGALRVAPIGHQFATGSLPTMETRTAVPLFNDGYPWSLGPGHYVGAPERPTPCRHRTAEALPQR